MRLRIESLATRFGIGAGIMAMLSLLVVGTVFYIGTVGVMYRSVDRLLDSLSLGLLEGTPERRPAELARAIETQMSDGADSDSEVLLLLDRDGGVIAGNLPAWPHHHAEREILLTRPVIRKSMPVDVRFVQREGPAGTLLVVGRDLREIDAIRALVLRSLILGGVAASLLGLVTASYFRRQIDRQVGNIRRAAREIGNLGDLSHRVEVSGTDEFSRLAQDINRMLEQLDGLVDGVRHVSNAIAHDLRTPLARLRGRIEPATVRNLDREALCGILESAMTEIDELIALFDRLLQIAEVESGLRTESFRNQDAVPIVKDVIELYDAVAEAHGVTLRLESREEPVQVYCDRELLANALANLLDNALKYSGPGDEIRLSIRRNAGLATFEIRDSGPGVPAHSLPRLTERFYRVDRSRRLPGHGLGLATVQAIVTIHDGTLEIRNASPGLAVRIELPAIS